MSSTCVIELGSGKFCLHRKNVVVGPKFSEHVTAKYFLKNVLIRVNGNSVRKSKIKLNARPIYIFNDSHSSTRLRELKQCSHDHFTGSPVFLHAAAALCLDFLQQLDFLAVDFFTVTSGSDKKSIDIRRWNIENYQLKHVSLLDDQSSLLESLFFKQECMKFEGLVMADGKIAASGLQSLFPKAHIEYVSTNAYRGGFWQFHPHVGKVRPIPFVHEHLTVKLNGRVVVEVKKGETLPIDREFIAKRHPEIMMNNFQFFANDNQEHSVIAYYARRVGVSIEECGMHDFYCYENEDFCGSTPINLISRPCVVPVGPWWSKPNSCENSVLHTMSPETQFSVTAESAAEQGTDMFNMIQKLQNIWDDEEMTCQKSTNDSMLTSPAPSLVPYDPSKTVENLGARLAEIYFKSR